MDKKKEILSQANIKNDLKEHFLREIPGIILSPFLIVFGFYLFKFIFCTLLKFNEKSLIIFSTIYFLFCSIIFFYNIYTVISSLFLISKNKYEITVDWTTDKLPYRHSIYIGSIDSGYLFRPYTLVFAKSGKYRISPNENYKWSDLFAMRDKNVYESTSLGDEFYVVSVGERKNIIGYNKKDYDSRK